MVDNHLWLIAVNTGVVNRNYHSLVNVEITNWEITMLFMGKLTISIGPFLNSFPRCSMYEISSYIWVIFRANVSKFSIHGASGYVDKTEGNNRNWDD